MFIFNFSTKAQSLDRLEQYFDQFSNLQFNSHVFAAVLNEVHVSFYDIYRKAPGLDISVKEVGVLIPIHFRMVTNIKR